MLPQIARDALPLLVLVATVAGCQPSPSEPVSVPRRAEQAVRTPAPSALPPRFERYSVTDGLASGFVRGVLQDRQGFLWIATADGLNRFDGETFAEFYNDPHDPTSLSQNYTNRLLEDDLGGIWIGHSAGVDRFDPATERFAHYRAAVVDSASAESAPSVYGLAKDAAGIVWVGFSNGELDRFDPATDMRTRVSLHGEASSLSAIQSDPDGTLWLGGRSGLHRYDPATGMLTRPPSGRPDGAATRPGTCGTCAGTAPGGT